MTLKHNNQIPEDEIDFSSILKKISQLITYPFKLFISNKFITLVFIFLALISAVSLKYIIPKTYTSSFILRANDKNERTHLRILSDIQSLLKLGDYSTLSNELVFDSLQARKITKINVYGPGSIMSKDSTKYTEIILSVTDYNILLPLQTAIINYIESNAYFVKIKNLQTQQIKLELDQINKELIQLDSLKVLQLANYSQENNLKQAAILLKDLIDPVAAYNASIFRINRKCELIARSSFLNNFQLMKSCVIVKRSNFPPRILLMALYLTPIFLLFCFILLHFKEQYKIRKGGRIK